MAVVGVGVGNVRTGVAVIAAVAEAVSLAGGVAVSDGSVAVLLGDGVAERLAAAVAVGDGATPEVGDGETATAALPPPPEQPAMTEKKKGTSARQNAGRSWGARRGAIDIFSCSALLP